MSDESVAVVAPNPDGSEARVDMKREEFIKSFTQELKTYRTLAKQVRRFKYEDTSFQAIWFMTADTRIVVSDTDLSKFPDFTWISFHAGGWLFTCSPETWEKVESVT